MDLSGALPTIPLKYLLSVFLLTSLLAASWYHASTPGPSVSFGLIFGVFVSIYIFHLLLYRWVTNRSKKSVDSD